MPSYLMWIYCLRLPVVLSGASAQMAWTSSQRIRVKFLLILFCFRHDLRQDIPSTILPVTQSQWVHAAQSRFVRYCSRFLRRSFRKTARTFRCPGCRYLIHRAAARRFGAQPPKRLLASGCAHIRGSPRIKVRHCHQGIFCAFLCVFICRPGSDTGKSRSGRGCRRHWG